MGRYASREDALASDAATRRVRRGHDKLITVRAPHGPGVLLLDGAQGGGAEVPRANDPRGTSLRSNCVITEGGYLKVVASRIPRFRFDREDPSALAGVWGAWGRDVLAVVRAAAAPLGRAR